MVSTTTRPWYGLFLSLVTALMWGVLPVSFIVLIDTIDAVTITWFRFFLASLLVWVVLWRKKEIPSLFSYSRKVQLLLLLASLALTTNFLLYLGSLSYLNPETAQILIQLAPFLLMFGGLFIYKEKFGMLEWFGVFLLILGFGLFFNDRLDLLFGEINEFSFGIILMLMAACTWSIYGLLQKTLLKQMNSVQLTLIMYLGGTIFLVFFSNPLDIFSLTGLQWGALIFCSANLVIAYGAFTEALNNWEAARVSAVITLAPLITILTMKIVVPIWPQVFVDSNLNFLAYVGALLVVIGSMLAAIGHSRTDPEQAEEFFHPE